MAGDSGTHGDVGSFAVTDLTDGDDIRVLTQNGAQAGGEGHAGFFVDLDLVDTVEVVFHGVFQGDQVHLFGIQLADHGVHGGGLAGTGGAHDQDNAVAVFQQGIEFRQVFAGQADALGVQQGAGLVEHTDNHLFTVNGGQGGDTQVNVPLADADIASSVQRDLVLGDIHVAHDLDTGNDRILGGAGNGEDMAQDTVDPHTDHHGSLPGLQMDIGCVLVDGKFQEAVHQSDGGGSGFAVGTDDIGGKIDVGRDIIITAGQFLQCFFCGNRAVEIGNGTLDGFRRGQEGNNLPLDGHADSIGGQEVQRIGHGQIQGIRLSLHGNDTVFLGKCLRDQPGKLPGDLQGGQVHKLDIQIFLQHLVDLKLGDETFFNQNLVDLLVGVGFLEFQSGIQLFTGNVTGCDQHFPQTLIDHF